MCENDGYKKLILKGLVVVVIGFFALYCPDVLTFFVYLSDNNLSEDLSYPVVSGCAGPCKTNDTKA